MSKLECVNQDHDWTYAADLRVRVCKKCDKWESIEQHEHRLPTHAKDQS